MNDERNCDNGWGNALSGLFGAGIGYFAGRGGFGNNNNGNGCCCTPNPCCYPCGGGGGYPGNGCQTCFQQGVYAGENNAGLNYIGQQVAGNTNRIQAVNDNINEKFTTLLQLQLNDKNAEISQLKNAEVVKQTACTQQNTLNLILHNLEAFTTGCAVRAVPACPPCPPA